MVDKCGWLTLVHTCAHSLRRSHHPGTGRDGAGKGNNQCDWNVVLCHLNDVCSGDPEAEPEVVAVTMGNQARPLEDGKL